MELVLTLILENPNFIYAVLRNHKRFEGKQLYVEFCFHDN